LKANSLARLKPLFIENVSQVLIKKILMFFNVHPILTIFSIKTGIPDLWPVGKINLISVVMPAKNKTIPVGKINTNFIRISQKNPA